MNPPIKTKLETDGLRTSRPISYIVCFMTVAWYLCYVIWFMQCYLAPAHLQPPCWRRPYATQRIKTLWDFVCASSVIVAGKPSFDIHWSVTYHYHLCTPLYLNESVIHISIGNTVCSKCNMDHISKITYEKSRFPDIKLKHIITCTLTKAEHRIRV